MPENSEADPIEDLRGRRFEIMAENFDDVFWMFNADLTETLYVNDEAERIYGLDSSDLETDPLNFLDAVHPEDRDYVKDGLQQLSEGERVDLEYRVNPLENFELWVDVKGVLVLNESGEVEVIIGSSRNVTQRKRAEKQLREEKNRMQTVVDLQNEVNQAGWDLDRIMRTVVNRLKDLKGADGVVVEIAEEDELEYRAASGLLEDQVGLRLDIDTSLSGECYRKASMKRCNDAHNDERVNLDAVREEGMEFRSILLKPLEYSNECFGVIKLVYEETNGIDRSAEDLLELVAGILSDSISQAMQYLQKQTYLEQVLEMAQTDTLTGLDNRRRFGEHLEREVERSRRYAHSLCFAIFDLDHFKNVNDEYGHLKGDDVLQGVARVLRDETRETDETGRFGGEELSLLMPETPLERGKEILRRLLEELRTLTFEGDGTVFGVTASAGLAQLQKGETQDDLIRRADEALYEAKSMGRDCFRSA